MKFGVCAAYHEIVALQDAPCEYVEVGVQSALQPERPREEFEAARPRSMPLPIEAANGLLPGDLRLVATADQPIDAARLERYLRTALQRAEQLGIRIIVFGSGQARACPAGCDRAVALEQIGAHLRQWGAWAQEHGVQIVLEPLSYDETNVLNTVTEAGAFLRDLAAPGCALLADTYHMGRNGEAPQSLLPWASLLAHVHVAEQDGRGAPGRHGEDLRPYLATLRQAGYDQRISIECHWRDLASETGPALATLRAQWAAVAHPA